MLRSLQMEGSFYYVPEKGALQRGLTGSPVFTSTVARVRRRCCRLDQDATPPRDLRSVVNRFRLRYAELPHSVEHIDGKPDLRPLRVNVSAFEPTTDRLFVSTKGVLDTRLLVVSGLFLPQPSTELAH